MHAERSLILHGPAEARLLATLHEACFPEPERWHEAAMHDLMSMPGSFAVVVASAGRPSGLALARVAADEAELLTIGVMPTARRAGIGRQLLQAVDAQAACEGATCLFLEVSVANEAARALYASLGFGEAGRRRRYYPDGSDALVLVRRTR